MSIRLETDLERRQREMVEAQAEIDEGIAQRQAEALSAARAAGYREGIEAAAKVAEASFADPGYHAFMRAAAQSIAAAIRALQPTSEAKP